MKWITRKKMLTTIATDAAAPDAAKMPYAPRLTKARGSNILIEPIIMPSIRRLYFAPRKAIKILSVRMFIADKATIAMNPKA